MVRVWGKLGALSSSSLRFGKLEWDVTMGENNLKNNKVRGCGVGSLKGRDGKLGWFSECEKSLEKAEAGRFYLPLSP